MAKKKTRKVKSKSISVPLPRTITGPAPVGEPGHRVPLTSTAPAETIASAQASFAEEYRYVLTDLKRVGVLAAAMFALLIVLAVAIG